MGSSKVRNTKPEFSVDVRLTQETLQELFAGGNISTCDRRDPNLALTVALNAMDHVAQELKLLSFAESIVENIGAEDLLNRLYRLGMQLEAAQNLVLAIDSAQPQALSESEAA